MMVEEPESTPAVVQLPIVRNAGTIGTVAVQWRATVNGKLAEGDIRPTSGEVKFAPGETMKTVTVEVLPDDVPEINEVTRETAVVKKNIHPILCLKANVFLSTLSFLDY